MERSELQLRERIERLTETYSLEELLVFNELSTTDLLIFLFYEWGFEFPDMEPC